MTASEVESKRTWNYRVIRFVDSISDESWQAIHEVHYENGKPVSYSENPAPVMTGDSAGDHPGGLAWILDRMREALNKDVLVEADFRPVVEGTSK